MRRLTRTVIPRSGPRDDRGFSLIELVVVMAILSIIVLGMGSVMMLATRDLGSEGSAGAVARRSADAMAELTRDVQFLTSISEQTDRAIAFTVPDRDGDGNPETIRYAWENGAGDPGSPGDPLTRTVNGGAAIPLVAEVDEFTLSYLSRVVEGDWIEVVDETFSLLLVVTDPASLSSSEQAPRDLLESWGYTITLIDDAAIPADYAIEVARNTVAYVSEEIDAGKLDTKLTDAPIGVVNEHKDMTAKLEVEEKATRDFGADTIEIVDDAHYITSPFALGDVVIATGSIKLLRPDGPLAPGAVTLASQVGSPAKAVLVTVEQGEMLDHGQPAAGRRVVLPWGKDLDFALLDTSAHVLMKRSIDWAAGNESLGGSVMGFATAFETPVENVRRMQIATQVTLPEDGLVTEIGAFIGGDAAECRFAIYGDAAGEPDVLLVESAAFTADAEYDWQTAAIAPTPLTAGSYWLALGFESSSQRYFLDSAGGELRYRDHWAQRHGFLSSWGFSDDSFSVRMSIYAAYTPD